MSDPSNHPVVAEAAEGRLPSWTRAGESRRAHMTRVSNLLREWAVVRGEATHEVTRWAALGFLHDLLRDATGSELKERAGQDFQGLPTRTLHGPVAAERLREEGVRDEELLLAVAYHTLGHPEFEDLGVALYAADFLEPGRSYRAEWRAELRERMPHELVDVAVEIAAARITNQVERKRALRAETAAFWSALVERARG